MTTCGVGCGVLIESQNDRITGIKGDPEHPANYGRLCSKGLSLPLTVASDVGRALYPEMRLDRNSPRRRVDWEPALESVAQRFAEIVRLHGPDAARPNPVHAAWLYAQMVRWGQAAISPEAVEIAKAVFRPDLYDAALGHPAKSAEVSHAIGAFAGPPFDAGDIAGHLAGFAIGRGKP